MDKFNLAIHSTDARQLYEIYHLVSEVTDLTVGAGKIADQTENLSFEHLLIEKDFCFIFTTELQVRSY